MQNNKKQQTNKNKKNSKNKSDISKHMRRGDSNNNDNNHSQNSFRLMHTFFFCFFAFLFFLNTRRCVILWEQKKTKKIRPCDYFESEKSKTHQKKKYKKEMRKQAGKV